ncbi:hypothetical protein [Caballeronia sp. DA-9]|uniref:hypothetical protein n=1 Tax=Caballeronia sp. DA-9 TaxID=3436237 RepID=UPI003F66E871
MTAHEVVIRDIAAMTVACLDHTGPYMQIGKAFDLLIGGLASRGLLSPGTRMVGIYTTIRASFPKRNYDRRQAQCCRVTSKSFRR